MIKYETLYIIILIFIMFILYFYRLPIQNIKNNTNVIYGPCYGKIMSIKQYKDNIYIAIFLSPFDVHYQFMPINGQITKINYDNNGKFNLAYELNKSNKNEKCIYTISTKFGDIKLYQIAGYFVRRISSFCSKGDKLKSGETIGLIHFGSRVDLLIPKNNFRLCSKLGDYVNGSYTKLGYYI